MLHVKSDGEYAKYCSKKLRSTNIHKKSCTGFAHPQLTVRFLWELLFIRLPFVPSYGVLNFDTIFCQNPRISTDKCVTLRQFCWIDLRDDIHLKIVAPFSNTIIQEKLLYSVVEYSQYFFHSEIHIFHIKELCFFRPVCVFTFQKCELCYNIE